MGRGVRRCFQEMEANIRIQRREETLSVLSSLEGISTEPSLSFSQARAGQSYNNRQAASAGKRPKNVIKAQKLSDSSDWLFKSEKRKTFLSCEKRRGGRRTGDSATEESASL